MPTPGRMLTRCCSGADFASDSGIDKGSGFLRACDELFREHWGIAGIRTQQAGGDKLHHVGIYRVAKGLKSSGWHLWKIIQLMEALQSGALARRHIPLLPANDRDLRGCHRNERW